jgi:SAM-dependent methyltransferase
MTSASTGPTAKQRVRRSLYRALWTPRIRAAVERVPYVRRVYFGWGRTHPYDIAHGVDTSGVVATSEHSARPSLNATAQPYGGSQPSIIRAAIADLPDLDRSAFVDLGCGKGRPLLVASEYPFQRVIGVEISKPLAEIAQANAAIIARQFPQRTRIEVQVADATGFKLPADNTVIFMYHPFGRGLLERFVRNLEEQLADNRRHVFIVYYNPMLSEPIDQSPRFVRWRAMSRGYASEELGFGPDVSDTLVIWQSRPERFPPHARADHPVVINERRFKAELA